MKLKFVRERVLLKFRNLNMRVIKVDKQKKKKKENVVNNIKL